jgi:hypothetical protein
MSGIAMSGYLCYTSCMKLIQLADSLEYASIPDELFCTLSATTWKLDKDGYVNGSIGHRHWKLHQIVWLLLKGQQSDKTHHIHHKDENKLNNTLENLEYITPQLHKKHHMKDRYDVTFHKGWNGGVRARPWHGVVTQTVDGKKTFIFQGYFATKEEAISAIKEFKEKV